MFSGLASYLFGSTNSDTVDNRRENDNIAKDNNFKSADDLRFLSIETEDDDWLLIDKEEEENSLPRTDSEEELPFVEIKKQSPRRSRRHNNNNRAGISGTNNYNNGRHLTNLNQNDETSQPLYVVSNTNGTNNSTMAIAAPSNGPVGMEESWFLTPPPCFTSTGPINMETSPFENLLIEHPSMSVYHSIRSAQEAATESFVNLDLGAEEAKTQAHPVGNRSPVRTVPVVQRNSSNRVEQHLTNEQMKQNSALRNSQKNRDKKERQNLCRGAMKRGNKAREARNGLKRDNCKNNGRQNYLWSAKQKC